MNAGLQDPTEILAAGARELGVALDAVALDRLGRLVALLLEWNERFNLTAIRDPADITRKHLLDSLTALPHLRGRRIADVGSGAGFPGLPLAIADPARDYTLIEATQKKARFLEEAVATTGLTNVRIVATRAEQWEPATPFDTVLTRAIGSLAEIVRVAGHLCGRRGMLLAMKGRYPAEEVAALPRGWKLEASHRVEVPGVAAERHVMLLARL
ncbi:MAG: 16S rRNA (guanine(527)-N(7))-methyltransferase RsmG [Steroidobacteraceae bacterium]